MTYLKPVNVKDIYPDNRSTNQRDHDFLETTKNLQKHMEKGDSALIERIEYLEKNMKQRESDIRDLIERIERFEEDIKLHETNNRKLIETVTRQSEIIDRILDLTNA